MILNTSGGCFLNEFIFSKVAKLQVSHKYFSRTLQKPYHSNFSDHFLITLSKSLDCGNDISLISVSYDEALLRTKNPTV